MAVPAVPAWHVQGGPPAPPVVEAQQPERAAPRVPARHALRPGPPEGGSGMVPGPYMARNKAKKAKKDARKAREEAAAAAAAEAAAAAQQAAFPPLSRL